MRELWQKYDNFVDAIFINFPMIIVSHTPEIRCNFFENDLKSIVGFDKPLFVKLIEKLSYIFSKLQTMRTKESCLCVLFE